MSDTKKGQIDRIERYANLIQRQTGKAVRPYRADGYVNLLNKYGTSRDASEHYTFVAENMVADDMLAMIYEGNGLFAKIIDTPAEEAVKHGFNLKNVTEKSVVEFYESALDELDWDEVAINCLKWARLFGGAIAVMLINDGRGLEEPLDWKNIRSIDDIRVYDRSVVQPDYDSMFSYDPQDPFRTRGSRLGMPEFYYVSSIYGSFTVHESRCLVFQNGVLPEKTSYSLYRLWGMPEYIRISKAIRDAEVSHGSAVKMLDRSVQAVYKMKDLSMELATEEGENRVLKRLQAIDMARGLMNSITIDNEGEDYDFRSFQFAGVSDVINITCNFLSALTSIPQTLLFGRSPAGMNSTGESDLENWYSFVGRIQKRSLKSNLRYLLSVIFQAGVATGEIDEVPNIKVEFNPLWSLNDSQQADLDLKKAQVQQARMATASGYIADQVLSPLEVRKSLVKSGDFAIDITFEDDDMDEENFMDMIDKLNEHGGLAPSGGPGSPDAAPAATKLPQDMTEEELMQSSIANAQDPQEPPISPEIEETNVDDILSSQNGNGGSVGVLVIKDGKILAGVRKNDDSRGLICGPGGHIEGGETPEMAAVRETYEEFGIYVNELIPIGKGKLEPETGLAPYLYICTEFEGEPATDEDEMTDASFLSLEEIKQLESSLFAPFADSIEYFVYYLMELGDDTHLDAAPEKIEWITVRGTAVPLQNGVAMGGGKLKGKTFNRAKSQKKEQPSGSKKASSKPVRKIQDVKFSDIESDLLGGSDDDNKAKSPLKQLTSEEFEDLKQITSNGALTGMKPEKKEIPIDSVYATQPTNRMARLERVFDHFNEDPEAFYENIARDAGFMAAKPNLPVRVVKYKGKNMLVDGNHRLCIMSALGEENAKVDFYDLDKKNNTDSAETLLDNPEKQDTITVQDNSDGAPKGNQNAAGPHKRQHLSDGDKEKYRKRIVGQTTSDGVTVKKFADHAFDRIAQRNLSPKRIETMLQSATVTPDKKNPNRRCYDIPGSRLVLDHTDGTIVTIEWRKQNK